jgi:UDP-N-acetylglucosamine transferase subunit ALG13
MVPKNDSTLKKKKYISIMNKSVLLTVGTTEFDELLSTIDNESFALILLRFGFTNLIIQKGRGNYCFRNLFIDDEKDEFELTAKNGLNIKMFRYHPDLTEVIETVDCIIGHAGAGTILEVMSLNKFLLVVINPTLQDNHQTELGDAIRKCEYCEVADNPSDVLFSLERILEKQSQKMLLSKVSFPILNPAHFKAVLNDCYGNS